MSSTYDIGLDTLAPKFTASSSPGFDGDGSTVTNLSPLNVNMTAGTVGYVVYSNGTSGLATEQRLSTTRGGLGVDVSTLTGALISTAGVITAQTVASANTAGAIVARDGSGQSSFSTLVAPTLTQTQGSGSVSSWPSVAKSQTVGSAVASAVDLLGAVQTTNATATSLVSYTLPGTNCVATVKVTVAASTAAAANSLSETYTYRLANVGGVVSGVASKLNNVRSVTAGLAAATTALTTSAGGVITLQVTGIAATTISWACTFDVVSIAA